MRTSEQNKSQTGLFLKEELTAQEKRDITNTIKHVFFNI